MTTVNNMVSKKVAFNIFNLNLPELANYTDENNCDHYLYLNTKGIGVGRVRTPRKYLLIMKNIDEDFYRVQQTDSEKIKKAVLTDEDKYLIPLF